MPDLGFRRRISRDPMPRDVDTAAQPDLVVREDVIDELAQVADALGHKTLVMARRYSHQSAEHVRATLATIAGKLEEE